MWNHCHRAPEHTQCIAFAPKIRPHSYRNILGKYRAKESIFGGNFAHFAVWIFSTKKLLLMHIHTHTHLRCSLLWSVCVYSWASLTVHALASFRFRVNICGYLICTTRVFPNVVKIHKSIMFSISISSKCSPLVFNLIFTVRCLKCCSLCSTYYYWMVHQL